MSRWIPRIAFLLCLGLVGLGAAVQGGVIALRWTDNMTGTARIQPGERSFSMPTGSVPRGGELHIPKEQRELAAARKNPVPASPQSVATGGELYVVYCVPCHGPRGAGDGLVATKFVPSPDLGNPDLQRARTDGYWHHQLSVGGPLMPGYAEALTSEERWHVVNYLRTLAQR